MSEEEAERREELKSGVAGPPGVGFQCHHVHPNELNAEFSSIDSQTPVLWGS